VRRSVLSVAVMGVVLALAAAGPGFSQINTSGFAPIQRGTFNLAEAYPAMTGSYTGNVPVTISPNGCWTTTQQAVSGTQSPTQAGQIQSPTGGLLGFPTTTGQTPVLGTSGGTQVVVVTPTLADRCNTTLQPNLFNAIPSFGQTLFAAAGELCLPTAGDPTNPRLNVNAFAMLAAGDDPHQPCYVQMARLTKQIPGSIKCPDVYGIPVLDASGAPVPGAYAHTYAQFGATPTGIRTWWSLNYTMPGTKFTLQVTVVCRKLIGNVEAPSIHVDQYTWVVVANADTLPVVINLEHTNTMGTAEIPCIVNEQAYCDLMAASGLIKLADTSGSQGDRFNAIQTFEGLIEQYCTFVDFVDPTILFPGPIDPTTQLPTYQPPSDLGTILGSAGSVGIIDSLEHPCCCKLLVDVEAIAQAWGVAQ
jgi:hypothetical protein